MPWPTLLLLATFAQVERVPEPNPVELRDEYYQQVASAYELKWADEASAALQLSPEPIHRYAHPLGLAGTQGEFFVWTRQGRPEVVGSIWSYEHGPDKRSVVHEFHSLADRPLAPVEVGTHTWQPQTAGVEWLPLPEAATPSSQRRLRLIQLRSLARQFTGFSTPEGKELRLRLLEHPVYRYGQDQEVGLAPPLIDGGLFILFNEWDPEIVLAIEARESATGARWQFAAARFNVCPLRLEHAGQTVWQVKQGTQQGARFGHPAGPFFAVHAVELLDR